MEKITYQEASKILDCTYQTVMFAAKRKDLSKLASSGITQFLIKEQVEIFIGKKQVARRSLSKEEDKLWVMYDHIAKQTLAVSEVRYDEIEAPSNVTIEQLKRLVSAITGKYAGIVSIKENEVKITIGSTPSTPSDNSYRGTGLQAPEHDNTGVLTLTKEKKEEVLTQLRYEETHDITSFYYISKLLNRTYNTIIINQDRIEETGKKVYDIDNGEIKKELDAMLELQIKLLRENELIGTNVIELVTMGKNDIETFKETHAI